MWPVVNLLGRIKLSPIDGGHRDMVIADHYMKWAFHFLVDADTHSPNFGERIYCKCCARYDQSMFREILSYAHDKGIIPACILRCLAI